MWNGDGFYYGDGDFLSDSDQEIASPVVVTEVTELSSFDIKQNDTRPFLREQLVDSNGNAINLLDAASVKFIMATPSGAVKVNAAAVIEDALSGRVRYEWATGDTDTSGGFRGEFQVTLANGDILTVPNATYMKIRIKPELGS